MSRDTDLGTVVLRTTVRWLTPIIFTVSLYLLLRGHNAPGGGFIAALVASAAFVLRFFAYGPTGMLSLPGLTLGGLVGAGLAIAVGAGIAGYAIGGELLAGAVWSWTLPLLGSVKFAWSLVFDVGVYVVVIGGVLTALRGLGEEQA